MQATRSRCAARYVASQSWVVVGRFGPGPPSVVRVVHVQRGVDRERIVLVGDRRIDHLEHEHALAGMGSERDERVAERCAVLRRDARLRERHERAAAAVAEQHDLFGASASHLVDRGLHIDHASLVEAVGVVVHVPGGEAEHGIAGRGEQRAGVVHAEVGSRMGEHHRRSPPGGGRWCPEHAPHDGSVGRDQRQRLASQAHAGVVVGVGPVADERSGSGHRGAQPGRSACVVEPMATRSHTGRSARPGGTRRGTVVPWADPDSP